MDVNESANFSSIDNFLILLHNYITLDETILILTFGHNCITGRRNRTQGKIEQI